MSKIYKLKPRVNKRNGQINVSIPRRSLPKKISDSLKKNPSLIKTLNFKMEGFDLNKL